MSKPIGGRGLKAPYETTHVRVPLPIKADVQALIDEFRERQTGQPKKPLTSLEVEEEEETDEEEDSCEPSDLETIKSQAETIRRYAIEIHALKRDLDNLNSLTSLEGAKQAAKAILKAKKSASQSVAKLLSNIYQTEIMIEDLK
jgi:tetrahydromethanopterin S-methyltransferase subunit A